MYFFRCGVAVVNVPGYELSDIDYKKPYPDCCPQMVKIDENTI